MKSPKILITIPPEMLAEMDRIATVERRNRADLCRESFRKYIDNHNRVSLVNKEIATGQLIPIRQAQEYSMQQ